MSRKEEEFWQVFRANEKNLLRTAAKYASDPEDVVQDVALVFARRIAEDQISWEDRDSLRNHLSKTVKWRARDQYRVRLRLLQSALLTDIEDRKERVDEDLLTEIGEIIDNLEDDLATVLMHLVDGLSIRRSARITGLKRSTVHRLRRKAIRTIRKELKEHL